jgi:hypothetical protein
MKPALDPSLTPGGSGGTRPQFQQSPIGGVGALGEGGDASHNSHSFRIWETSSSIKLEVYPEPSTRSSPTTRNHTIQGP